MSFKQNLLTKIQIDQLSEKIIASIGPADNRQKLNREAVRTLIEMAPHQYQKERDLHLYTLKEDKKADRILVLDNELAIYDTTVDDVVLRKSPTLKEMLSIRNAIKILNDAGVVVCKREATVNYIKDMLISRLNLSFGLSDLTEIEKDGVLSLERDFSDGVRQSLDLFGELLGYRIAPQPLQIANCHVTGALSKGKTGEWIMEPVVIYNPIRNTLKRIDQPVSTLDPDAIERMHLIDSGKEKGSGQGPGVFAFLKDAVISKNPVI